MNKKINRKGVCLLTILVTNGMKKKANKLFLMLQHINMGEVGHVLKLKFLCSPVSLFLEHICCALKEETLLGLDDLHRCLTISTVLWSCTTMLPSMKWGNFQKVGKAETLHLEVQKNAENTSY